LRKTQSLFLLSTPHKTNAFYSVLPFGEIVFAENTRIPMISATKNDAAAKNGDQPANQYRNGGGKTGEY